MPGLWDLVAFDTLSNVVTALTVREGWTTYFFPRLEHLVGADRSAKVFSRLKSSTPWAMGGGFGHLYTRALRDGGALSRIAAKRK